MSFANLKNSATSSFEKLTQELDKLNKNSYESNDDKLWKPTVDKVDNGYAVIRFLPAPDGEDLPFVRIWDHGFQGPTGLWYIENSLTTLGQPDPVSEHNSKLWNSGVESDKELARKQKRKLSYFSNIYVVKDPSNPATEGKVFLFRYGKKIFDKINDIMYPEFDDEKATNPFDFWAGANFKMKIRKVDGYRNYDKSEFDPSSKLFEDDSEMESVWNKQHSLKQLVDPKNFKSYEELKKKLNTVLATTSESARNYGISDEVKETKPERQKAAEVIPSKATEEDDDDNLAFFKQLAEDE